MSSSITEGPAKWGSSAEQHLANLYKSHHRRFDHLVVADKTRNASMIANQIFKCLQVGISLPDIERFLRSKKCYTRLFAHSLDSKTQMTLRATWSHISAIWDKAVPNQESIAIIGVPVAHSNEVAKKTHGLYLHVSSTSEETDESRALNTVGTELNNMFWLEHAGIPYNTITDAKVVRSYKSTMAAAQPSVRVEQAVANYSREQAEALLLAADEGRDSGEMASALLASLVSGMDLTDVETFLRNHDCAAHLYSKEPDVSVDIKRDVIAIPLIREEKLCWEENKLVVVKMSRWVAIHWEAHPDITPKDNLLQLAQSGLIYNKDEVVLQRAHRRMTSGTLRGTPSTFLR